MNLVKIEQSLNHLAISEEDGQVVSLWLATKNNRLTYDQYTRIVVQFFNHVQVPMRQVNLEHMLSYQDSLRKYQTATRAQRLAVIKSLFRFATDLQYLPTNVTLVIKADRGRNPLHERIINEEEVLRMIVACKCRRDAVLVRLLYRAGLRVTEAISVRFDNLRFDGSDYYLTVLGKGSKTRTIKIIRSLAEDIISLRHNQNDQPQDRIFPISRQRAWQIIKRIAAMAGVTSHTSPHWLRHAHATHALKNKAPIKLVADTLGHANISVTDKYLHSNPDESSGDFLKIG